MHGRGEKCKRIWWEIPKEKDDSKDRGVDRGMGSEWILGGMAGGVRSGFSLHRIGTGDEFL
jgi:hypothetical protein